MSIADRLTELANAKNNIKAAIESKGVTPTGGLSTYADAIESIQQEININGGVDYTQIGWSQDVSNAQNIIDNAVLHNHLEYSKEIMQHYQNGFSKDDSWIYEYRYNVVYMPNVDTHNVTDMGALFGWYSTPSSENVSAIRVFPSLDTQNVTNMRSMFGYCTSLESVGLLDCKRVKNVNGMFMYCYNLMHLEGFENLGYSLTGISSLADNTLDLRWSERLTKQSVLNLFNTMYDNSGDVGNQYKNHQIWLSTKTLSLLSDDEIAIATNKGWNIKV